MEVIKHYIVIRYGKSQQLFELEDGTYKITDTGQYKLEDLTIEKINKEEAEKLIKQSHEY